MFPIMISALGSGFILSMAEANRVCPHLCYCFTSYLHLSGFVDYMIPFQCNIANATGTVPVAKGNPARRCGEDPYLNRPANPANCTVGARTPIYWFQFEGNNVCRLLFCQRICAVLITFALNPNDSLTFSFSRMRRRHRYILTCMGGKMAHRLTYSVQSHSEQIRTLRSRLPSRQPQ